MPKVKIPPLLWSIPNMPPPVEKPNRNTSVYYPFWLSTQEPLLLSESKRQHLLRDVVEMVATHATAGWGTNGIRLPKSVFVCEDAPRVQEEYNRWLHSWDWSEPFYTYSNTVQNVLLHAGAEPWLIASTRGRIDLQFAVQLSIVMGYATERMGQSKANRLLRKLDSDRSFQMQYANEDDGRAHAIADFVHHWCNTHTSQSNLLDYMQTWLSLRTVEPDQPIRPRPSFAPLQTGSVSIPFTYDDIDTIFHGLIASSMHQEHLKAPKEGITLPTDFDLSLSL